MTWNYNTEETIGQALLALLEKFLKVKFSFAVFIGIIFIAFKKANFTIRMALLAFLIVAQFNPLSIVEISLFWFLLGQIKTVAE